jgi:hypothetical protein
VTGAVRSTLRVLKIATFNIKRRRISNFGRWRSSGPVPTDADIYNPRSWRRDALLQRQSRECYRRLLAQGWLDTLRAHHGDERVYTFWDDYRDHWKRNAGLRIDHLLLNEVLAPRFLEAGVDLWVRGRPKASDHAPAWIRIDRSSGKLRKNRLRTRRTQRGT